MLNETTLTLFLFPVLSFVILSFPGDSCLWSKEQSCTGKVSYPKKLSGSFRGSRGIYKEWVNGGGVQKKNFPLRKYLQSDACVRLVSSRSISSCQRSVSIPWCPIPGQKAKHSLAMIRVA